MQIVLYVRYLSEEAFEWEEACIQFQGCGSLSSKTCLRTKIIEELESNGFRCLARKSCVDVRAPRDVIDDAIQKICPKSAVVVDVRATDV